MDENIEIKNDVIELQEQLNILWNERKYINNLDSKIINDNEKYNEILKNWINPSGKINAELLYRLLRDGDKTSTFMNYLIIEDLHYHYFMLMMEI